MKKIISVLLILVMAMSMVACNSTDADKTTETTIATKATISPIEEAKSLLQSAYDTCCTGKGKTEYAKLGYDKMSLVIDTKPDNGYFAYEDDAVSAIVMINTYLVLPSSLTEKMSSTRALDGTQSQNCGKYTVTWNYHPDNGLKVIYEVNP